MRKLSLFSSLVVLAILLTSAPASADVALDWSVGAKGGAGGVIRLAPSDVPAWTATYPLFDELRGGWTYGGGVFGELRVLRYLGFEIDAFLFHNVLKEDTTWNGGVAETEERLEWTEFRLSALVKGVLPLPGVRLWLGVGPEFSFPFARTAKQTVTSGPAQTSEGLRAQTDHEVLLALAFGLNVEIGPVSIPIDFRWSYNLTAATRYDERVVLDPPASAGVAASRTFTVVAEPDMDARLLVGVAYEF